MKAWGLGPLGPMKLRLAEVWVRGLGLRSAWADDVEVDDRVTEKERERERERQE